MTLDFYKRVLKKMVSSQEASIKNDVLTDVEGNRDRVIIRYRDMSGESRTDR